jgi:hypothetical protein
MKTPGKHTKNNKMERGKTSAQVYDVGRDVPMTVYHNPSDGFDSRQFVCLYYSDSYTSNLGAFTAVNQQYRMNSLFDPDLTGTGHQPYRFDQLATFFARYRVRKFEYLVQFQSTSMPLWTGVGPTNGDLATPVTTAATFNQACEVNRINHKAQCYNGAPSVIYKGVVDLAKLGGTTYSAYNSDDRYQALVTTNPTELLYFNVMAYNPSGGTVVLYFSVRLKFYTEFFDPVVVAQS